MALTDFTHAEVVRLRRSFLRIIPRIDRATDAFYGRLFQDHPEVRSHFRPDLRALKDKLVDTLAALLDMLHRGEDAVPSLMDLGRRHAAWGATDPVYRWIETALPEALALAEDRNDEADPAVFRELWPRLLREVAATMQRGASTVGCIDHAVVNLGDARSVAADPVRDRRPSPGG